MTLLMREQEIALENFNKGIEQGIEKGILDNSIQIAKNLLDILDDDLISLKTGLSLQQVIKLRNNNNNNNNNKLS